MIKLIKPSGWINCNLHKKALSEQVNQLNLNQFKDSSIGKQVKLCKSYKT